MIATAPVSLVWLDAADGDADIVRGGSRPLALVEGGPPPIEYLMFAPGVNETVKGPLLFDDEAASAVLAFYEGRGRKRLAGDWEHDSMVPAGERPANYKGSPASHWFGLEVRPGPELWAVDVKWTPTAFAQIQAGEYAHTSPVVKFQKASGRIMAVLSSALTNDPATIGQPQLVAASADSQASPIGASTVKDAPMPMFKMSDDEKKPIKDIVDGEHESREMMCGKLKACLSASMPEFFGEKKSAGEEGLPEKEKPDVKLAEKMGEMEKAGEEMKAKMGAAENKEMMTALRSLTGKAKFVEQVAVLTAMKHASEDVAALTAKLGSASASAFKSVMKKGRKAMKLTPADCAAGSSTRTGQYIASLRAKGDEGVVALSAYVDALVPRVVTAETAPSEAQGADLQTVTLTAVELASAKKNGVDPKAMLAIKRERAAELVEAGYRTA